MQVYCLVGLEDQPISYHGDRGDAHEAAKAYAKTYGHHNAFIDLLDIPSDKAAILSLLNEVFPEPCTKLRSWCLTPRLGLKELPNDEPKAGDYMIGADYRLRED